MTIKELRCGKCNKLLFKYQDLKGGISVKCPRCKEENSNLCIEEEITIKDGAIQPPKIASYIKL